MSRSSGHPGGSLRANVKRLIARDKDGGELAVYQGSAMTVIVGARRRRRVLYCTKASFLDVLRRADKRVLDGLTIFSRPGLLLSSYADLLAQETSVQKSPVIFVGDLKPVALLTYLSLRHGGVDRLNERIKVDVNYKGIDDEWLDLCASELLPELRKPLVSGLTMPVALAVKMRPFEQDIMRVLDRVGFAIEEAIGPACARLLRSGVTVDLTIASDPVRFRPGFGKKLIKLIVGRRARSDER
jgi:hypothetical protein